MSTVAGSGSGPTGGVGASRVALFIAAAIGVAVVAYSVRLAFADPALLATQAVHAAAALAVLAVLAFAGLNLLFKETRSALLVGNGARVATPVAIGVVDAVVAGAPVFDTQNKDLPNYVPIARSFNRLGGAELTYAFWVFKSANLGADEGASTVVDAGLSQRDLVLLVKGDPTKVGTTATAAGTTKHDVLVKAPLVKFDGSTDRLSVEFNTSEPAHVDGLLEGASVSSANLPRREAFATKVSVYGLNDPKFNARWFHVAVVLKDTDPSSRYDRNIQARVFVNGESVFDRTVVGRADLDGRGGATLRQNSGFLYLLPTVTWTVPAATVAGVATPAATLKTSCAGTRVSALPTGDLLTDASGNVINAPDAAGATASGHALGVRLADVWHYNYALEDAEVQRLYAKGFTKKMAAISATAASATVNPYPMSEPTAWQRVLSG